MYSTKKLIPRDFAFVAVFIAAIFLAVGGLAAADGDFSVVLLPDTQNYSKSFPETYVAQTEWIASERDKQNIRFVIHLGDIVDNHDAEEQWQAADRAHKSLDGVVPYSVLPGNHDAKGDDAALYNKYFPPERFRDCPWYGGHEGETNENNYCTFEAAGMKFLVLSLKYAPGQKTLDWTNKVLAEHADCRAIVATHEYLTRSPENQTALRMEIWDKLVRKHKNVFLVVCGHFIGTNLTESKGDAGQRVWEMLVDYQGEANGGDGWLRILRFSPAENKITVRDYSPTLRRYKDGAAANYSLDYPMSATSN